MNCPICRHPLRHDIQSSCIAGRPPLHLYTCDTNGCVLAGVTLADNEWLKMTQAQIDAYGRSNALREAQRKTAVLA